MSAIINPNNSKMELKMIDNKTVNADPNNEVDAILANYVFTMLEALPAKSIEIIANALDKTQKINKAGSLIRKCAEKKGVCPADLTLSIAEKFIPLDKQDEAKFFEKEVSALKKILDEEIKNEAKAKKEKYEYSFVIKNKEFVPEDRATREALDDKYLNKKERNPQKNQKMLEVAFKEMINHNLNLEHKLIEQRVQINASSLRAWVKEHKNIWLKTELIAEFIKNHRKEIDNHNEQFLTSRKHFNFGSSYYQKRLKKWTRGRVSNDETIHAFQEVEEKTAPENKETGKFAQKKHLKKTKKEMLLVHLEIMKNALEEMIDHNSRTKLIFSRVQINKSSLRCWIKEYAGVFLIWELIGDFIKSNQAKINEHNKHYCSNDRLFNAHSLYYQENLKKWSHR